MPSPGREGQEEGGGEFRSLPERGFLEALLLRETPGTSRAPLRNGGSIPPPSVVLMAPVLPSGSMGGHPSVPCTESHATKPWAAVPKGLPAGNRKSWGGRAENDPKISPPEKSPDRFQLELFKIPNPLEVVPLEWIAPPKVRDRDLAAQGASPNRSETLQDAKVPIPNPQEVPLAEWAAIPRGRKGSFFDENAFPKVRGDAELEVIAIRRVPALGEFESGLRGRPPEGDAVRGPPSRKDGKRAQPPAEPHGNAPGRRLRRS